MNRRELLKLSLLTCGAALTSSAQGSGSPSPLLADDNASASPVLETSLGKLRGAFANGVYSFKGVHYGASTEGARRFQPPLPAKPWTGVRDALELGPPAPQYNGLLDMGLADEYAPLFQFVGPGTMSEDCLVLNVWTPTLRSGGKRPVMVWLHGGSFAVGSDGVPMIDGTNLSAKHDVVVVGVNHRLNAFGHLYLGKKGGERYADSGNVGMLDIVLALQWVRDNIAQFGGDPGNVTIFGESGGGWKVSVMMAMPAAKGLFHKAIVESGPKLRVNSTQEAEAFSKKFLDLLHVTPDRLDDLLKIPMEQYIAALHAGASFLWDWGPVLDGRSLPRNPFDPDAPAITADVPLLIGTTASETTVLVGAADPRSFSLNEADMRERLKKFLELSDDSKLDALIGTYKRNRPNATPSDIYFAVTTDSMMRLDSITEAERKVAQHAASVFMYIFAWPSPVLGGRLKAAHVVDVAFVFDNVDKAPEWVGTGPDLQPLADRVSSSWVAFARSGNPNHAGLPHWPAYDVDTRATMTFNNDCKVVNDPGKEERLAMAALHQT
jgi:para-nitrobenzyl esterase